MTNKEMKKTAIQASVFAAVSIGLMLYRSATKHIMITDAAGTDVYRGDPESSYNLLIDDEMPSGKENTLIIPLSRSVSSDNIILEDDYNHHQLRIYIDSREEGFYLDNAVKTDLDSIESAVCITQNETGSVCLEFTTDDLYVNESSLTDSSTIEVNFYRPHEKYEHVVLIDPADEGMPLDTALMIKELADRDVTGKSKFYFTRLTDTDITVSDRARLLRDSDADIYVELTVSESEDISENGISSFYNDRFFLKKLPNASFADMLLKSCNAASGAETEGVFALDDDLLLMESKVPSAKVSLGYVSGDNDSVLLEDEGYKKRMAEGIYNAVMDAFEIMEDE